MKLKPEELWFSTLTSQTFKRELKLGEKVSIETADYSVWQHHVQQLAQAEQNVQILAYMFIYAFTMCAFWHQHQHWGILRRSQCIKATIIYSNQEFLKSCWYCRSEKLPNVDRTWQNDSSVVLLRFCYSQDFLELNLCISHQKIKNTSKEMPEKPLSSSSLDLAECDTLVTF